MRCILDFYKRGPRYNRAIINVSGNKCAIVKLYFAFVLKYSGQTYPLAFVQPMQISASTSRAQAQESINYNLALCRVKIKKNSAFIPLKSILRGTLLYADPIRTDEYLVVETIETSDMFLQLKEVFSDRFFA